MASWNSRGLRGSLLEEMINITNDIYKEKKLGIIQKIPTPITPIEINKESRHITLAYFEKKSTVDYIGVIQGIAICFDAKECASDSFSLNNIHEHQIEFMNKFEEQSGIAFLLIYFKKHDSYYYMTNKELNKYIDRARNGGRKSFKYSELEKSFFISIEKNICIHYLEKLQLDLEKRDKYPLP